MTKLFLLFNVLAFGGFGLLMFLQPERIVELYGAGSVSSDGLYEIRGIYGGVSIGAALLMLAGAMKPDMQRPALYFLLAYTGGYAVARIAALPLDGVPSPQLIFYAGFEIVTALIALFLLRKTP